MSPRPSKKKAVFPSRSKTADLSSILSFLDELLTPGLIPDVSHNGLQFPGKKNIRRVVTGVDASTAFLKAAQAADADLAIVHHGLFWKGGEWRRIDRFGKEQMRILLESDMNLFAQHLPLDMHPIYGNNALIAKALEAKVERPFADFQGNKVGLIASFAKPLSLTALLGKVTRAIGPLSCHLGFGPEKIERIGIISGGGWSGITDPAVNAGHIQAIVTGEVIHQAFASAQDRECHMIAAGHYATEVFGVKAIGELLAQKFGVEHRFLNLPTGL